MTKKDIKKMFNIIMITQTILQFKMLNNNNKIQRKDNENCKICKHS